MTTPKPLLNVSHLKTWFYTFDGVAKAVDDVSVQIEKGQVVGIVGESGCGKSVTARSIMRLIPEPPGKIVEGEILFDGIDLVNLSMEEMRTIRGNRIAMIFQEPMTSLNPVFTIGDQIGEMFRLHQNMSKHDSLDKAAEMLARVQIPSPESRIHDYPHQLSGGMRQRAMIAMALSCDPEILIADEPTTALDVTVQAQILDLMLKLQEDFDTSIMMITHDLGVIAEIASRVVVMYAGKVVEEADTIPLFEDPQHPYTRGLLKSIPKLGGRTTGVRTRLSEIEGMVPGLLDLPQGCSFNPRCGDVKEICRRKEPPIKETDSGHLVRCWLYHDDDEV